MRILHVISSCNPKIGGPIQGIRNYQKEISNRGIKRDVVCFEEQEDIELWNFPESLNVIGLGKSVGPWQYNKNLEEWLVLNYNKYNAIIINGLWIYNTYGVVNTIKKIRKTNHEAKTPKLYIFCHGMLDPWFQKSKGRFLKSIRNLLYWHLIEKKNVKYVDGLLFTTEQEKLLARTTFKGYKPKKEINIGYGIELPPPKNTDSENQLLKSIGINQDSPYILYLSRIDPKKGLDILLKAYLELLNSEFDSKRLPLLLIAGDVEENNFSRNQVKYINENPILKTKVKFLGHLSGNNKWSVIYGCEAYILPSHTENFGISVAENLGCSKPVIITDKVNIFNEVLKFNAGLISDDTLSGIKNNIIKWIEMEPELKIEMGRNAFNLFQKKYRSEDAVSRFLAFLEKDLI